MAIRPYCRLLRELESRVRKGPGDEAPSLGGAQFGRLDAYALTLTRWGTLAGINPEDFPTLWAFVQKVAGLPAVQRVIERERLQLNLYKAA